MSGYSRVGFPDLQMIRKEKNLLAFKFENSEIGSFDNFSGREIPIPHSLNDTDMGIVFHRTS